MKETEIKTIEQLASNLKSQAERIRNHRARGILAAGTDSQGREWEILEREDGSISVYILTDGSHLVAYDSLNLHIRSLISELTEWQSETFPNRSEKSILDHLKDEVNRELLEGCEAEELADVLSLLLGLAAFRGIDIFGELMKKLQVNKKRNWEKKDGNTYSTHLVEEESLSDRLGSLDELRQSIESVE